MKLHFGDGHKEEVETYGYVLDFADAAEFDHENEGTVVERLTELEEFTRDVNVKVNGTAKESIPIHSQHRHGHN